jgi:nucleotide-binding universal stress UspA family protein
VYSTILVGTDGSPTASQAVAAAARLATDLGAALHIASAYGHPTEAPHFPLSSVSDLNRLLDDAGTQAADLGAAAEKHILETEPAAGLLALAADIGADLIVVGNRGLGAVQGYFLGSVPAKVVRDAPCSVMVVKTD